MSSQQKDGTIEAKGGNNNAKENQPNYARANRGNSNSNEISNTGAESSRRRVPSAYEGPTYEGPDARKQRRQHRAVVNNFASRYHKQLPSADYTPAINEIAKWVKKIGINSLTLFDGRFANTRVKKLTIVQPEIADVLLGEIAVKVLSVVLVERDQILREVLRRIDSRLNIGMHVLPLGFFNFAIVFSWRICYTANEPEGFSL